jgi:ABC-2 type transport system permease protein
MRNVGIVIRHEIHTMLSTRSFWVMTFLFPALIFAFTVLPQASALGAFRREKPALFWQATGKPAGFVDHAGLIKRLPQGVQSVTLREFTDEVSAQQALVAGIVDQYYVIPRDFMASGKLLLVDRRFSPLISLTGAAAMERVIDYNLVGDEMLAELLSDPTPSVQEVSLAPATPDGRGRGSGNALMDFAVPFGVMFVLFFVITLSAGFMLQSVSKEKQSRTAEVLLLSLRPRDLMFGKLVGLGIVALLQMAVWLGASLLLMGQGSAAIAVLRGYALSPAFAVWTLLYFLGGYVVYASALGALGALVPNLREGSQMTFIILMPLLLPILLNSTFIESPDGALATVLSLFPLTAPTSMPTRLVAGSVPAWQPVVGLLGLAATAYAFVLLSARFFSPEALLSDTGFGWQRIIGTLRRPGQT